VKVAVLSEAGTLLRTVIPELGVTPEPCCSLIVTVLLEGSVQVMVIGWPAVTCRPAAGMLILLF
jgi:hypothetical protein